VPIPARAKAEDERDVNDITESIVASTKQYPGDFEPLSFRIANRKSWSFLDHYRILWIFALGLTICLTAAVGHAQQLSVDDFAPTSAKIGNGWWSPERTAATVVVPRLQLSMSKLTHFETTEPLRPSTTAPSNYRPTKYTNNYTVNPRGFELSVDGRSAQFISLAEAELLSSRSFLSLLEANYRSWESRLADTRSLTNVNGVFVYPLVQIDYADWRLPISLYIPPLRGSDTR